MGWGLKTGASRAFTGAFFFFFFGALLIYTYSYNYGKLQLWNQHQNQHQQPTRKCPNDVSQRLHHCLGPSIILLHTTANTTTSTWPHHHTKSPHQVTSSKQQGMMRARDTPAAYEKRPKRCISRRLSPGWAFFFMYLCFSNILTMFIIFYN